ncbi:alpha/beta hydrolase [Maribacter sp.]
MNRAKAIPTKNNPFYISLVILFFMNSCHCIAQDREKVYLKNHRIATKMKAMVQHRDTIENIQKITNVDRPNFLVYSPEDSKNNGVGIIICPGGGYYLLAADLEGYEIAEWLNSLGYTAFVLHYSVPNKRRMALEDVMTTVSYIRNNNTKFKVHKNKIGVLGFSAGGHLAAKVASIKKDERFAENENQELFRPDFSILIYAAYLAEKNSTLFADDVTVGIHTGPTFLFATADDSHTNGSLAMAEKLRQNGVPFEVHVLAQGGHGYGLRKGNKAAETWPLLAENWLRSLFQDD